MLLYVHMEFFLNIVNAILTSNLQIQSNIALTCMDIIYDIIGIIERKIEIFSNPSFECSIEPPSFKYPQHIFWLRNTKNNFLVEGSLR